MAEQAVALDEDGVFEVFKNPGRKRWLALREKCITSTEIAPVAGIPKYGMTRFSIYHTKRGSLEDQFVPTARSEAGLALEHAISKMVAKQIGARVLRLRDFMRRDCLGASFDYHVVDESSEFDGWLIEIKNVDGMVFRDQWEKDAYGNDVPPEHIILQTQAQLEVSRRPGTILGVLVGGNDLRIVKVGADEAFGRALRKIANDFWADIEAGNEPSVIADDAANAAKLYNYADPDSILDASEDHDLSFKIATYKRLKDQAKSVEAQANAIKAEVLVAIKDKAKVFCSDGYTLDAGVTSESAGKEITPEMVGQRIGARSAFRRFTVRKRKEA